MGIIRPEFGPEKLPHIAIPARNSHAFRQAQIGTPQQGIHHLAGKRLNGRRGVQEVLVNTGTTLNPAEFFDQVAIPAGMHRAEVLLLDEQGNGVKPFEKLVPLMGIGFELIQRFFDQSVMAGIVFPQPFPATARAGAGAIAQGIVFVVAHHDAGRAVLHHIPHQVKCFADTGPAINDITDENGLAARMLVYAVDPAIAHLIQQPGKRVRAAMNIANNVITATCGLSGSSHAQLADISLAQPSLSRQVA